MSVRVFVDTNVLFYSRDSRETGKRDAAVAWLKALAERQAGVVNLQVLNEFCSVALRRGLASDDDVFRMVRAIGAWGDAPLDEATVADAREVRRDTAYGWWDCLLLAAARQHGCRYFLSEDLADGRQVGSVQIVDPFKTPPERLLT